MSLTTDDLNAITGIVNKAIEVKVPPIVEEIVERIAEEKVEAAKRMTAVGFEEVHDKIAHIQDTADTLTESVGRIERRQIAETERADWHSQDIVKIKTRLSMA